MYRFWAQMAPNAPYSKGFTNGIAKKPPGRSRIGSRVIRTPRQACLARWYTSLPFAGIFRL